LLDYTKSLRETGGARFQEVEIKLAVVSRNKMRDVEWLTQRVWYGISRQKRLWATVHRRTVDRTV